MKRVYRLSSEARRDLVSNWKYLSKEASVEVADKVNTGIYAAMERLSRSPGIGHSRTDLTDLPIKFYRVHRYLILYDLLEKPLGIVRILHGARDIPSILHGPMDRP